MKAIYFLIFILLNVAYGKVQSSKSHSVDRSSGILVKQKSIRGQQSLLQVSIVASIQESVGGTLTPGTARALLVSCAALYGSNYPLTKLLQDSLNPSFVTTLRFMIASLFFLPSTFRGLRGERGLSTGSIELGIWCSIGFISQAMILTKTSASKAAFFCGLSVLMPPIFDLVERLVARAKLMRFGNAHGTVKGSIVAAEAPVQAPSAFFLRTPFIKPFLALCGAAILEWGSGMEPARLSDLNLLITPVSFAMCFWRSAQLGTRYPAEIASITGIMLSTVAVVGVAWSSISLNFCCSTGESNLPNECTKLFTALCDRRVLSGLFYSGIATTAFTSYVEQQVIRVLTAAETTLIYTLEPLFATAFAAFFLKEHVTSGTLMGAAFIIFACLWDTLFDYVSTSK